MTDDGAMVQEQQVSDAVRIVVLTAGVSEPSSTRLLADRAAQKTMDLIRDAGCSSRSPTSWTTTCSSPNR